MPQLEANYKRFINGEKVKQEVSKSKAKPKQEVSKAKANVNVNVNVNEKKIHTRFNHLCLSIVTSLRT
jgi:hypothetical protein